MAQATPAEQSSHPNDDRFRTGLTTTFAPFIEQAQANGQLYIEQPYDLYSEENHQAWKLLYARMQDRWHKYANPHFLKGIESLCLDPERVPRLEDVNRFLCQLTGFRAKAVSGYVPAFPFFDCLRQREFPTTITIRRSDRLDYLPEPDIFHDISGHVPMHTDKAFADTLVRFGDAAHQAAEIASGIKDDAEKVRVLTSMVKAMARFFWFSIEFGLMKREEGSSGDQVIRLSGSQERPENPSPENLSPPPLCVYGSGLLSSYGEIAHSIDSPDVQRYPFQLEWVVNQYFEIDHYQPLLFYVDSFDHLFSQVDLLIEWMKQGKLNNVSPGDPEVGEADLKSFLHVG
ncbi:MAG: phenylalanine 4-monooxygenase [Armatimonadetes bacterium]|nr:phenylalanine 4-monooxygenase [Armatimonadota bacterium]